MARKQTGIRRMRGGWQAYLRINGQLRTKQFPLTTPLAEMRDWREAERDRQQAIVPPSDSLAADVARYLTRCAGMPTIEQRAAHLALWVEALGGRRSRDTVTALDIETMLEEWLNRGLAPGTVKKRRTALQSFYVKMNGPRGRNPVKGTPIPREPKAEARHLDRTMIERAIAAMPARRSVKPGTIAPPSLAPVRAAVLAATGIPPGLLKQVKPHDLVLVGSGSVRVTARMKGGGVEARTVPLTPDGLAAFQAFHAANAYGGFATQALNRAFKRGCRQVGIDPKAVCLYDLRHSFLTDLYRVTRDLATVGRLGLHAEGSRVTARYAQGANTAVDAAAVAQLGVAWAAARRSALKTSLPVQEPVKKLRAKVARLRKVVANQ